MPIFNPQEAFQLISINEEIIKLRPFLVSLLPIASQNVHINKRMMLINSLLTNYILQNLDYVAQLLQFSTDYMGNFNAIDSNNNIYDVLINIIEANDANKTINQPSYIWFDLDFQGLLSHIDIKSNIPKEKSYFYTPYNSQTVKWLISVDHSIAVLSMSRLERNYLSLIYISSLIIAGAGYTMVLSIFDEHDLFDSFFSFPLFKNFFSETHIFAEIKENFSFDIFKNNNFGYLYLYLHFKYDLTNLKDGLNEINNPFIKIFFFSKKLDVIFNPNRKLKNNTKSYHPSAIELSGFQKQTIQINICNAPLYKSNDRKNDWTPQKISEISIGKMFAKDFYFTNFQRVKVSIEDEYYFIDFSDIHLMNPELYIKEPMYLSDQDFNIDIVEEIMATYKDKTTATEKIKVQNPDIKINIKEKMHSSFHYLYKFMLNDKGEKIKPYTSQVYAVYQAMNYMGNSNNKGVILQVKTGEGKSFIVQALAEQLARQKSVVHIATSNIILAARDFEKSYKYFKECEKKKSKFVKYKIKYPSILIHENEYEYVEKFIETNDDIKNDTEMIKAFYSKKCFHNKTNMNISVCKNDIVESNIIFSTFLNFEAYYLHRKEKDPYCDTDLQNCYLIIDEADTILIDEIANGTILSKPMKSNGIDVLKIVYEHYISGNKNPNSVLEFVIKEHPECTDLTSEHIERMFSDIEQSEEYRNKKNYVIVENKVESTEKKVIPFDSKHKGISEPNKEFNGYVHQFIGIKHKEKNPKKYNDLQITPLSMNYLFISHPIFVKKYKGVCGVTGTIGSEKELYILDKYYDLVTHKVPRHQMNLKRVLPRIICDNISIRNDRICQEIISFHDLKYPVLVVFSDLKEIKKIKGMLINEYKIDEKYIKLFTGSNRIDDESDKKLLEDNAGISGQITLGTNYCGRGVDITYKDKPLVAIISYENDDQRAIQQVMGRSGRNGFPGIARIICTKQMLNEKIKKFANDSMESILKEFDIKNAKVIDLINTISEKRKWIFNETDNNTRFLDIDPEKVYKFNKCNINVNRITAFNFEFPIGMSYETFLDIQVQRIFSLKNCPECKYTWRLFGIYLREMIFESWSLFVDFVDFNFRIMVKKEKMKGGLFYKDEKYESYNSFFSAQYTIYKRKLLSYFNNLYGTDVPNTFYSIYKFVYDNWHQQILNVIPTDIQVKQKITSKKDSYTSFRVGFFQMCLAKNSGVKMSELTPSQQKKADESRLYIIDPELKYVKKGSGGPFSITKVIDFIYEKIQEVFDTKLQGLFGVRFFLRRTLGGCEFGAVVDPLYQCEDKLLNCLFDRNPIIMFTVCTKSTFFWLSGTLMILLIFIKSLCGWLFEKFIDKVPALKTIKSFIHKGMEFLNSLFGKDDEEEDGEEKENLLKNAVDKILDRIIEKLTKKIKAKITKFDKGLSIIFDAILNILSPINTEKIDDSINEKLFGKLKINEKVKEHLTKLKPFSKLIKIGGLIILNIALFALNFVHKPTLKFEQFSSKQSDLYQKEFKKKDNDIEFYDSYKNLKDKYENDIENDMDDG